MKWFRHFCNSSKSDTIQELIELFGKCAGEGFYWRLTAYCADKWDGKSDPSFKVRASELRELLGMTARKLDAGLTVMQLGDGFSFSKNGSFYLLKFPKLLEIFHRDAIPSGQRPKKIQPQAGREQNRREQKRIYKGKKEFSAGQLEPDVDPRFNLVEVAK